MEFSIKYTSSDYLAAVKYKMSESIKSLRTKGKYKYQLLILRLISPFVIFGIVIYASFTKLRNDYKFILSPVGMTRFTNESEESAKWSRFSCYEKTEKFILLQLDKNEGENDGQVLFPKRCFNETEWLRLIEIFEVNNVNSGKFDRVVGFSQHI